ncbi:hypothetical protein CH354_16205 [Leptospira levettii]|uniref:hypothetical protein n=2 Tax=Leptospira levettii TaxID=2023178 RepID=UPI000C29D7AE|nr:hypothetical protein [Leptospira levettii]PJZ35901.1 hypothetical protein CH354_16205 [Leptospira levettii]PJZ90576.1 hypothetical protein CH368_00600 [Leptospira levettii]PJZ99805.1 hypothetical protein CH369_13630 [Leptospira levettii]
MKFSKLKNQIYGMLVESFHNFKRDFLELDEKLYSKNYILFLANFFISFALLFLRKPDSLLNAQLWAEDGVLFLHDEWHVGFPDTIFILYAGYVHFVPRLVAFISNFFPFEVIPFIFNFSAIFLSAISVSIFSLTNFRYILKSDILRTLVVVLICLMPIGPESINNITNVHFYLSLGVFLIALIGGSLSRWAYFLFFLFVLLGILSAPLAVFCAPLFLIRPILCRSEKLRWLYVLLFVISVVYGFTVFQIGSKESVPSIDWLFLANPFNIEKLIRVTISGFLINDDYFAFLKYFKFLWLFELFLLFQFINKFRIQGIQTSILLIYFLLTMFIPILLRGGLTLTEEQLGYAVLLNSAKDNLYFGNVLNLIVSRYGVVPYFLFCIFFFVVVFESKNNKSNYFFPLAITILFVFIIRNSIFIKPFEDLNWKSYGELVKNKQDVVIPINPPWFPKLHMKKEDWR